MFNGIGDNAYLHFVHSFYVDPADKGIVAGQTNYGNVGQASLPAHSKGRVFI